TLTICSRRSDSPRIDPQRCFKNPNSLLQILLLEHVGDAHFILTEARRCVKSRRRSHHHSCPLKLKIGEQPCREVLTALDRQTRHEIESAFWLPQKNTGDLSQSRVQQVSALLVLFTHPGGIFRTQFGCALGNQLSEPWRRQATLCHTQTRAVHRLVAGDQCS